MNTESHEYVFAMQMSLSSGLGLLPRTAEMDARYPYTHMERENGRFVITSPTGKQHEPQVNSHWRYAEKDVMELFADNRISFGLTGDSQSNLKRFLSEVRDGVKAKFL